MCLCKKLSWMCLAEGELAPSEKKRLIIAENGWPENLLVLRNGTK